VVAPALLSGVTLFYTVCAATGDTTGTTHLRCPRRAGDKDWYPICSEIPRPDRNIGKFVSHKFVTSEPL